MVTSCRDPAETASFPSILTCSNPVIQVRNEMSSSAGWQTKHRVQFHPISVVFAGVLFKPNTNPSQSDRIRFELKTSRRLFLWGGGAFIWSKICLRPNFLGQGTDFFRDSVSFFFLFILFVRNYFTYFGSTIK